MPDRIQIRRTKGYRKPEGAVVVTRATIFGNPWAVGSPPRVNWPRPEGAGWISDHFIARDEMDAAAAVAAFRAWIEGYAIARELRPRNLTRTGHRAFRDAMAVRRGLIFDRLTELRGRDLCCYCPPDQPCHADVLLDISNNGDLTND